MKISFHNFIHTNDFVWLIIQTTLLWLKKRNPDNQVSIQVVMMIELKIVGKKYFYWKKGFGELEILFASKLEFFPQKKLKIKIPSSHLWIFRRFDSNVKFCEIVFESWFEHKTNLFLEINLKSNWLYKIYLIWIFSSSLSMVAAIQTSIDHTSAMKKKHNSIENNRFIYHNWKKNFIHSFFSFICTMF